MEKGKKLISLKEAAELSGYSSDYVGQLIRSGKIFGEQTYSNVVWMTTEDAVLDYRNNSKNKNSKQEGIKKGYLPSLKRRFSIEVNIFRVFFKTFKSAFLVLLFLFISVIFLVSYIAYILINPSTSIQKDLEIQNSQEIIDLNF
ncbi:MAG: hypothetical protein PF572_00185 [Patescibacteria group bacterium]|jgi:hypothetical protein|nr:hypothetical protein [Patescibacteria group bacterium]